MKFELNTQICPIVVPDTYGTGFCYDIAEEMWDDFKQLMIDKAEEWISDALAETDFAKAKLTMGEFGSPREYNYETDWIDFTLEVDDSIIDTIKAKVDDDFFEYIKKYESHSGFISFYPTKPSEFFDALNGNLHKHEHDREMAVSMYIMYQFEKAYDASKYQNDYLDDVWEYALANGYTYDDEDVAM